jgi:hypothetical protein
MAKRFPAAGAASQEPGPVHHAATAITAPDTDQLPAYWQFHDAVARAQLLAWLPRRPQLIVDVSGPRSPAGDLAAMAGHKVLRVIDAGTTASQRTADAAWADARHPREPEGADWVYERGTSESPREQKGAGGVGSDEGATREGGASRAPGGERDNRASGKVELIADSARLSFLPDGCADEVIAEDRALSTHLVAEAMIAEIARVLRPAGRVLACVDSLVLGMAVLADQHHWAHLVDLPHAEVVLVPWPDGTITRCYGPDQARELFSGAGLTVNWIRPRTVFSESMVTHVLRRDPGSLPKLVRAELAARSDESLGAQLVISASKLC